MGAGSRASHPVIPGWEARCRHVLDLVFIERTRQVAQYGHNEDLEHGMGPDVCWLLPFTTANAQQVERALRRDYEDFEEDTGKPTWAHLIREELAETFTEADPLAREEEALQVAALLVSYVENSRRIRLAGQPEPEPYVDPSNEPVEV